MPKPALPFRVLDGLLTSWQHRVCSHRWIRARWEDHSYGLRCSICLKRYPRTWNDVIEAPPVRRAA